jgi:hypothetical protein
LTERQWARLENALVRGDRSGQLVDAWIVGQELQLLYRRSHDLPEARHRRWKILDRCARSEVPELLRLARTLDAWRPELLEAFTTGKRRRVVAERMRSRTAPHQRYVPTTGETSRAWLRRRGSRPHDAPVALNRKWPSIATSERPDSERKGERQPHR